MSLVIIAFIALGEILAEKIRLMNTRRTISKWKVGFGSTKSLGIHPAVRSRLTVYPVSTLSDTLPIKGPCGLMATSVDRVGFRAAHPGV